MSQQPATGIPAWTVGDRLGKALSHAGLSVGEMSTYLGISRNTVGNYINDRTRIPRPTLMMWSLRTGVPIEWIEHGTGSSGTPTDPEPGPGVDVDAVAKLTQSKRSRSGRSTRQYLDAA